jgi:hypothetical protein
MVPWWRLGFRTRSTAECSDEKAIKQYEHSSKSSDSGLSALVWSNPFSNGGHYDWGSMKIKWFALAVFYTGLFFILKSNEEES